MTRLVLQAPALDTARAAELARLVHPTREEVISANVLRTLGGTVSARNRDGGGGEVTLTLPIAAISIPEEGA